MSEEEFLTRVKERVRLRCRAGQRPFEHEPDAYAVAVAPIWWQELGREWLPERCADEDSYFW
jgi:hypothetical protein